MSRDNDDTTEPNKRLGAGFLDGVAPFNENFDVSVTDPKVLADAVIACWQRAPEATIWAGVYLAAALQTLGESGQNLEAFLRYLVSGGVLSENDALGRLRAHGKLSMLRKIGQHADSLLQPSILRRLPAYYSIIYQFCLLIEDVGADRAKVELSTLQEVSREDLIKRRAELKVREAESGTVSPPPLDYERVQLFALDYPSARDQRFFSNEYVGLDTLARCFRRPDPADGAGLVGVIPIRLLGLFERTLMPLLGFRSINKFLLESGVDYPDITDRNVIAVAERGDFPSQPLTAFPSAQGLEDVLTIADRLFPHAARKCNLFARKRTEGWLSFVGDENWNEMPSL